MAQPCSNFWPTQRHVTESDLLGLSKLTMAMTYKGSLPSLVSSLMRAIAIGWFPSLFCKNALPPTCRPRHRYKAIDKAGEPTGTANRSVAHFAGSKCRLSELFSHQLNLWAPFC